MTTTQPLSGRRVQTTPQAGLPRPGPETTRAGAGAPGRATRGHAPAPAQARARSTDRAAYLGAALDVAADALQDVAVDDVVVVVDVLGDAPVVHTGERSKIVAALVRDHQVQRGSLQRFFLRSRAPAGFVWTIAILPERVHVMLASNDDPASARPTRRVKAGT